MCKCTPTIRTPWCGLPGCCQFECIKHTWESNVTTCPTCMEGPIRPLGDHEGLTGRFVGDRLKKKLFDVIDEFNERENITYIEVVGVLEIIKYNFLKEGHGEQ